MTIEMNGGKRHIAGPCIKCGKGMKMILLILCLVKQDQPVQQLIIYLVDMVIDDLLDLMTVWETG